MTFKLFVTMSSPARICAFKLIRFTDTLLFTPQPLRAVRLLFLPMVSAGPDGRLGGLVVGLVGGWAGSGKSLSGLYLRNHKV